MPALADEVIEGAPTSICRRKGVVSDRVLLNWVSCKGSQVLGRRTIEWRRGFAAIAHVSFWHDSVMSTDLIKGPLIEA